MRLEMARRRRQPPLGRDAYRRIAEDLPYGAQVVEAEVDDPYSLAGEADKIVVLRSIRDDSLAERRYRGRIDEAQYQAGRHWQRAYERSEIGAIIAMDPTKEPVDGHGPSRADFTDQQLAAFKELEKGNAAIGENQGNDGVIITRQVLGQGLTIKEVCRRNGFNTERWWDYHTRLLERCLDTLAEVYGYVSSVDKRK